MQILTASVLAAFVLAFAGLALADDKKETPGTATTRPSESPRSGTPGHPQGSDNPGSKSTISGPGSGKRTGPSSSGPAR